MSVDADLLLLDRVFQPLVDRAAAWATCFDLARVCLIAVIVLHTAVLAWDLNLLTDPLLLALIAGGTLIGYRAASQQLRQIARAERRCRPGMMNIQRVTLRPFRLTWLGVIVLSAAVALSSERRPVDLCAFAVSISWLAAVYFASCTPSPPPARSFRRGLDLQLCLGGAGIRGV